MDSVQTNVTVAGFPSDEVIETKFAIKIEEKP